MDAAKRSRLARAGWTVGSAEDFLGLGPAELAYIDLRIALGDALRARRVREGITQAELASRMGSSQSRVAKMEAADPGVTLDLVVKALLTLGARPADLAAAIAGERAA